MSTADDHVRAFRDAMEAAGVAFSGTLIADGRFHRVKAQDDKEGRRTAWYVLHLDGVPSGAFGSLKLYGEKSLKWTAKGAKPLTREERRAIKEKIQSDKLKAEEEERLRHARAAAAAAAMWESAAPATDNHPYLKRKGVRAIGLRVGDWIKESPPDAETGEIRTWTTPNTLLIPLRDEFRNILSLQAIFPKEVRFAKGDMRGKDFVYGGRKRGCWFTIGSPTEVDGVVTILVCEGYATGASLHVSTGLAVVVAFDAGNLAPVAQTIRRLMPDVRIVVAGDNDQWTLRPVENPGATRAREAAESVSGLWVVPQFSDTTGKPTDFNDLQVMRGSDEVSRQVMAVIHPQTESEPSASGPDDEPPPHDSIPEGGEEPLPSVPTASKSYEDMPRDEPVEHKDTGGYFTILGHDRDKIYVYQHEMKMVVERGIADWSDNALISVAPLLWWEMNFAGEKGLNKKAAVDWIVRTAFSRGFFDPSMRRGRGAWRDDGRNVFHFGDRLMVDGAELDVTKIDSRYVYEQGRRLRLPADVALTDAEGRKVVELAKRFRWQRPASALLLVGFCALAPLCGAMKWRSHIWITGGTGSGKSTILNDFVNLLMNGTALYAQGNSTEAGIRQTLKNDALPVLFDESEQNDEREVNRVQAVIALIRQSSTESDARTMKGTTFGNSMEFMVRSMFCLASVQVGMRHQADYERLTVLSLRPKRDDEDADAANEEWESVKKGLFDLRADQDLPARLLRRSIDLLPTTIRNIETFGRAAAKKFGSQRDGDQFGTLLAGAWSIASSRLVTDEEASAMLSRYDWSDYIENSKTEESTKAMSALLGAHVRLEGGVTVSVYELASVAAGRSVDTFEYPMRKADAVLRRHGMKVKFFARGLQNAALLLQNTSTELPKLLEGTPYSTDPVGQIGRVTGTYKVATESFNGQKSRALAIPLSLFIEGIEERVPGEDVEENEEMPF